MDLIVRMFCAPFRQVCSRLYSGNPMTAYTGCIVCIPHWNTHSGSIYLHLVDCSWEHVFAFEVHTSACECVHCMCLCVCVCVRAYCCRSPPYVLLYAFNVLTKRRKADRRQQAFIDVVCISHDVFFHWPTVCVGPLPVLLHVCARLCACKRVCVVCERQKTNRIWQHLIFEWICVRRLPWLLLLSDYLLAARRNKSNSCRFVTNSECNLKATTTEPKWHRGAVNRPPWIGTVAW